MMWRCYLIYLDSMRCALRFDFDAYADTGYFTIGQIRNDPFFMAEEE